MKRTMIFILLLMFASGCVQQKTRSTPPDVGTAYPKDPINGINQGYPYSPTEIPGETLDVEDQFAQQLSVPPADGYGNVVGTLLLKGEPVKKVNLFLAGFIKDSSGKDAVAFVTPGKSPEAVTDNKGRFVFINVPIGNYGVVMEIVTDTFILMYPDGSDGILVSVENQQTVDLGTLDYDDLPVN